MDSVSVTTMSSIAPKLLKLALTLTILWMATATYTAAQVVRQSSTSISSSARTGNSPSNDPASQFFELRCRGGMTYRSDNTYNLPAAQKLNFLFTEGQPTPQAPNVRMMNMQVNFTPATEGAGSTGDNLKPGQCAWVDRGFRPGEEPFIIRQPIVYFGQLYQLQHGMPVDSAPAAAEKYPDSQNVPEYLKDENHYWTFLARYVAPGSKKLANGSIEHWDGYFEAESSHYWKPPKMNQEIRPPRSTVSPKVKEPTP